MKKYSSFEKDKMWEVVKNFLQPTHFLQKHEILFLALEKIEKINVKNEKKCISTTLYYVHQNVDKKLTSFHYCEIKPGIDSKLNATLGASDSSKTDAILIAIYEFIKQNEKVLFKNRKKQK